MSGEFFKGIMPWEFNSKGSIGKLPVFYYDNTSMTALFTASTKSMKKTCPIKI